MALALFVRDPLDPAGIPLFATSDPAIVRAVVRLLMQRVERDDRQTQPPPKLRSVPRKPKTE
jgi:hypothetical protein